MRPCKIYITRYKCDRAVRGGGLCPPALPSLFLGTQGAPRWRAQAGAHLRQRAAAWGREGAGGRAQLCTWAGRARMRCRRLLRSCAASCSAAAAPQPRLALDPCSPACLQSCQKPLIHGLRSHSARVHEAALCAHSQDRLFSGPAPQISQILLGAAPKQS